MTIRYEYDEEIQQYLKKNSISDWSRVRNSTVYPL